MNTEININDHRITLFYFFDHHCPVENLKSNSIIFPASFSAKPQPLWENHSYNLSKDLVSPIHQLFHNNNNSIKSWHFSKKYLRSINQENIQLQLRKRSKQRLQQTQDDEKNTASSIRLIFEQLVHHKFRSGFSIACLELKLSSKQQLTLTQLNETVSALARFNKLKLNNSNNTYSLGQLIRLLHGESTSENKKEKEKAKRVYTHSYIQICQKNLLDEVQSQQIISQLALRYTSDYQANNTQGRLETIDDYHNVSHALAQEGSATLVQLNQNDAPEILKNYKNAVIRPAHQPIHLLAVHLENAMQQYQKLTSYWINQPKKLKKHTHILAKIEHQLRNFRLNFFHPIISHINSHNQIQQKLYRVKQLDAQFNHLGKNTDIISQLIKHQHQTRYCKLASFGVAAAGYLTSFSIIKEGIESLNEWQILKQAAPPYY